MNVIFTTVLLVSAAVLLFIQPQAFLTAMLGAGGKALTLAATLFSVYSVWLSLSQVAQKSGVSGALAKKLQPLCARTFGTKDPLATQYIAMNVTCNLLGVGGAATPFGVKAMDALRQENNDFAQKLLFLLNATSIQLFPTTVIALRASAGSANAGDIFLPTLICSFCATIVSLILFFACPKKWR